MSIYISGITIPERGCVNVQIWPDGRVTLLKGGEIGKAIELPDHGDLIERDAFRKTMYHDTFETDSDLQKWESGCWIRYKMFERNIESAPVVIPAERE